MIYDLIELQRQQLGSWVELARQATALVPVSPLLTPMLAAQAELMTRSMGAFDGHDLSLEEAVRLDAARPLEIEELPSPSPFTRLVRFSAGKGGAPILFVAPYSGYAAAVASGLVAALVGMGEVLVTDWLDARHVALAHGRFDLPAQVRMVAGLLAKLPARTVLVGLSQSGTALVGGAALAMARGRPAPAGIALLRTPIDMRQSPGQLQLMLEGLPPAAIEQQLIATVPDRYAGAGRRVYPGLFQLIAYTFANPASYLEAQAGLWREMVSGERGPYGRLHGDMHGILDVPAELYQDMLDLILRRSLLAEGGLEVDGVTLDPARLAGVPLMTVEARQDELVGAGQVHAAHALTAATASDDRAAATAGPAPDHRPADGATASPRSLRLDIDGGHQALFGGPSFAREVVPPLARFVRSVGRA